VNDLHYVIDFLLGLVVTGFGFVMNRIWQKLDDYDEKFAAIPETYARRDDVKDGFAEIKAILVRMEERQNRKEDHG
jgi:hypothetical protein